MENNKNMDVESMEKEVFPLDWEKLTGSMLVADYVGLTMDDIEKISSTLPPKLQAEGRKILENQYKKEQSEKQ